MPTAHNDACNKAQQAARDFEAEHPAYCRSCGGTGSWHDPGTRYHSDGSGTPLAAHPNPECFCWLNEKRV